MIMLRLVVCLTLTTSLAADEPVALVPAEGEAAKYWPRWRGPGGQGVVENGSYPDTWSDTQNVLWKAEVPGKGNSSPIIWQDRIFLTTSYEQGKRRSILSLDRKNGQKVWETFTPISTVEKPQAKNGFCSGTPCTDGERVYAYFGNFGLLCVDMAGKQLWHKSFGAFDAFHGTSCSPLLYKDAVIVFQDHRGASGSFVAAFDRKTGAELWKTARKEKVGWGSPVAVRVGKQELIIVSSENAVYAYEPGSGKQVWRCAGNLVEVTPTPVAGLGMIFCCSGRAGPTLAIRPPFAPEGGTGDISKSNLAWKTVKGSPFIPSPLLYGDYLYMVNDVASVITCFEARTGKMLWQERAGQAVKHGFSASPIGVNGKVFFTNDDGDTYVYALGSEYKLLHVNRLKARTLASPALLDGMWYIRTEGHLWCIGEKK